MARIEVVSPFRLVVSVCRPQCREFWPEKAIAPSDADAACAVEEPTTCGAGQAPAGQWTCQSMSLSGSRWQPGSCGGMWKPPQPMAASVLIPPSAEPTVNPNV